MDLLGFYILYEGVLIPMFLIIGVWGARKEKITAAYYFFFYTFVGSIIMLLSIIYLYNKTGSTDYAVLLSQSLDKETQKYVFLAFLASFAVKIPKYPFHIWLPLAHVEAPLSGSILLAAVLIKLGSYGFIRFALPLLPDACHYFAPLVNTMALLAIIYASVTTIRQTDLKRIIAYSSIGHMGVVMLGIFSLTTEGIEGSIYLQIGHGLVSSALFIIVTNIYDRHHTRLVKYYRGLAITMPIWAIMFVIFTMANIAVPLSCNFIGEFLSLYSIYTTNIFIGIIGGIGIILSAGYALLLLNRVTFGSMSPYISENRDLNRREFYILFPLAILTVLFGVYPSWIFDKIHYAVINLLI
jgi:proton-translocating NADH-quinone oxidoreductase chain M